MFELALLRTKFSNGHSELTDLDALMTLMNEARESDSPFRNLILNSLSNAVEDLQHNAPKKAAIELNLVHNIGLGPDWSSEKAQRYFYFAELPDYLGEIDDLARVKRTLSIVSKLS